MRQLVFVAVSAMLMLPQAAGAWVRTTTCRIPTSENTQDPLACRDGESPIPIYWQDDCVVFHVNELGTGDVPFDEASAAILDSFETWDSVSCSSFRLVYGGQTNEDRVGYYSCDPAQNANVVMFIASGWTHQSDALALTSVTYDMTTGVIVDADIELNDQNFNFTTTDLAPMVRIDLQNTVTHEIGHLVGFDHTTEAEATMFGTAPPGETLKRDLHQDDIDGFCSVYSDSTGGSCSAATGYFSQPSAGPGDACEVVDDCACSATQTNPTMGYLATLLIGLFLFVRPWRRRERR